MPIMDLSCRPRVPAFRFFDALKGLFECVGPHTNGVKTVSMACRPCNTPKTWSTEAYTCRVMGMTLYFLEWLSQMVHFLECGVGLADRSLTAHRQQQHGVGREKVTPLPHLT